MKEWEAGAALDEISARVLGVERYLARLRPANNLTRIRIKEWRKAPFPPPSVWERESRRLHQLEEELLGRKERFSRADLSELPTMERPFRKLAASEVFAEGDLFEVKRFLFFALATYEEAEGLQELPGRDSESWKTLALLLEAIHPGGAKSSRFHLSGELSPTLGGLRSEHRELREEFRRVRERLEEEICAEHRGRFDIHGVFQGEEQDKKIDDRRLVWCGDGYRVFSDELDWLRERLQRTAEALEEEEEGLRAALTERIRREEKLLRRIQRELVDFDLRLAMVELKRELGGTWPELMEEGETGQGEEEPGWLVFEEALGPFLLEKGVKREEVQSIDLRLHRAATVVVGPNMGGKSTLLRLVGLFQWCAQMGLPLPAKRAAVRPVERVVYVGSEEPGAEEAEAGLSSFGREIQRLVDFWEGGEGETLWLLDEPARGTHPEEGAELARRVVENRIRRGDRVVAATHFPELARGKGFACLKVRGLQVDEEGLIRALNESRDSGESLQKRLHAFMDYGVDAVQEGEVPREAARIARALGLVLD